MTIATVNSKRMRRTEQLFCCCIALFGSLISGFLVPHAPSSSRFIISSRQRTNSPVMNTKQQQLHMMMKYEDFMETLPSETVVNVVDALSEKRVVASDVAARAGISLSQARQDLIALVSLSQGDIAVDQDGELIYQFPANLKQTLATNSAKYKAAAAMRQAWPKVFWAVRASFGVALVVSVAAIFSTIFFLQSSSGRDSESDDRRDDRRGGGGGGMMNFGGSYLWGPSPLDFLYWNRPYGYYSNTNNQQQQQRPDEMGFLPSVFSYVFGDGNPNETMEEKRLALAATMIRNNKGAVTAEQLAPFCDNAPDPAEYIKQTTYVDENFVLPIVTALGGEAQVTDDGEIIYTFAEMQTSASSENLMSPVMSTEKVQESLVLQRAGLPSSATSRQIQNFLNYNGISTAGAVERNDLIQMLRKALPPPSESEQRLLKDAAATSQTDVLIERPLQFSVASDTNKFLAGALGVVNLGGALYLGNLLGQYAIYGVKLPSYMGVVQTFYPLLLLYAVLFNVIPLARNAWNQRENAKMEQRNQIRTKWRDLLLNNTFALKLKAAATMGMRLKQLGANADEIVFDTRKPIEDMKQRKMDQELKDFDKLLRDDGVKEDFQ